jgi:two-component system phosphate regulon sensor histidine kinase PhoR
MTWNADGSGGLATGEAVSLARRLFQARAILAAAAIGLGTLVALDGVEPMHAAVVFALVAAASLFHGRSASRRSRSPEIGGKDAEGAPPLDDVLDAVPDPLIILDGSANVRLHNAAAGRLIPTLRRGQPFAFALRVPEMIEAVRTVLEQGGARRVDYSERVPVERDVEAHISSLQATTGRGSVVLVLLRDVSQQRKVEQMRADFVANASHELRTPLASVLGFVETLQGSARNDPEARERFLGIIRAQAMRMARLIDDLLSLSRIELNAHVRPNETVELGGVLGHVADTLAPLAKERNVTLRVERPDGDVLVAGDRDELIRLFENLVENAIKYGASGGKVEVTLVEMRRTGRTEAAATVRDFGPGIASDHLPRLTERFYRVDAADSRDKGGTGLGLAIVKHILARHRGRLGIQSAPGEGAAFTVTLETLGES